MNTFTLLNLVLNPEKAGESDLETLEELVQEYPYFQAGHLLIAKITGDSAHIKRAAAYTSERAVLMNIINSEFNPDVNMPNIDNLEIGKDDLSLFEKLGKDDGSDTSDDDVDLGKDDDFNETFGDFEFDDSVSESPKDDSSEIPEEDDDDASVIPDISTEPDDFPTFEDLTSDDEEPEITTSLDDLPEEVKDIESIEEPEVNIEDENDNEGESIEDTEESETLYTSIDEEILAEDEDEEEDDLMDELAELRRLQAEMQKSREEAEAALQEEEDREADEKEVEVTETNDTLDVEEINTSTPKEIKEEPKSFEFSETNYDYPEYSFDENKTSTQPEESTTETVEEDSADDLSFFEEDTTSNEDEDDDKNIDAIFGDDDESDLVTEDESTDDDFSNISEDEDNEPLVHEKTSSSSSMFNFDDDSLFDLDSLLAQEGQQIDAIKEIESRPKADTKGTSPQLHNLHSKQSSLIDDFIEKSPSIKIPKDSIDNANKLENDLTESSIDISGPIVSENLATIYVKQGKYSKAIDIYKQLILKYPEKKVYFADLIDSLENK